MQLHDWWATMVPINSIMLTQRQAVIGGGLVIVFALAIWLRSRYRRSLLDLPIIPGPAKEGLPLLGNMLQLVRPDFHRLVLEWANRYGGIFRVRALWFDGLVVTDPQAMATICGRGEGALDKASLVYMPINQMCSPRSHPNLLTSAADPAWRAVRKAVAVAFSVQNIRKKFPVIRACSQQLIDQLIRLSEQAMAEKRPPLTVDVDQCALRVTLDVIGMVMLRLANPFRAVAPERFKSGHKGEQSFADFQREMRVLLRRCLLRPTPPAADDVSIGAQLWRAYHEQKPSPSPPASQSEKGSAGRVNGFDGKTPQPVTSAPAGDEANDEEDDETAGGLLPPPLTWLQRLENRSAQLLASMRNKDLKISKAGPVCAERILSEIGILFIEGFETTGHTISWTLYNISTTPGVQECIAEELESLGLLVTSAAKVPPMQVEVETLPRLVYLAACVKEAMRMLPVVSVMGRVVGPTPTRVGPYLVPARTPVAIPLFGLQNSDANWERPHDFIPERWLKVPIETYVVGNVPSLSDCEAAIRHRLLHVHGGSENRSHNTGTDDDEVALQGDGVKANSDGVKRDGDDVHTDDDSSGNGCKVNGSGKGGSAPQVRFAPFSEGPRNCVGQTLAKIEVMSFLVLLLSNFRVELAPEMGGRPGIRARESTHLTLQTKGIAGIRMLLHPRWGT